MSKARAPLLVGAVIILGLVAFVGLYRTARQGFEAGKDTYQVHALFDDVSGLGVQTRVTLAGVQVGEVKSIGIDEEYDNMARVTIVLKADFVMHEGIKLTDGYWSNGATLTRKQASLLGDQYLELRRGLKGRRLGEGMRIRNVVSVSGLNAVFKQMESTGSIFERLDKTFQKLDEIATDVKQVSSSVRNILGGSKGEARLEEIATNIDKASGDFSVLAGEVKEFAREFREFMGASILGRGKQVGRVVDNVERFSRNAATLSSSASTSVGAILDDVKSVTKNMRILISGSKGDVESSLGSIKGALASFTRSLKRLDGTLNNVESITKKINTGKGSLGKLVNDDKVITGIEEVVTDAGDLVKRVTEMKTSVELQSEFYMEQQALKNYLRIKLQPKADKYYLLELVDDPRGKTKTSSVVTQTNDPSLPPVVHETSSTTDEGIKISFQFAKRWHFLTGRFGIIKGTGGLGLDV